MAGPERQSSFSKTVRDEFKHRPKIGDILQKEGQITKFQLEEALGLQKKYKGHLGSILLRLGYIDEETIPVVLQRQQNIPVINIADEKIDEELIKIFPYELAKEHLAFPLKLKGDVLRVAMADPTGTSSIEEIQRKTKFSIKLAVSAEIVIIDAFKKYYNIDDKEYQSFFPKIDDKEEDDKSSMVDVSDFGSLASEAAEEVDISSDADNFEDSGQYSATDAPIIKLVNGILIKAINEGVSDIHIEPFEKAFYVRYRLDGALYKSLNLPMQIKNALISRLKIMSGLNITERRIPQDGRIKLKLGKRKEVDFRVSVLPTLFGEGIVLRLLDKSALNVDLTKLGFSRESYDKFNKAIAKPYGLVLVTGPTGSGKTTTLYSALNVLNTIDKKILTAEDPVEYNFKGINQVLVRDEVGMTFASALKAFLRQDPDIIMVGEIRDLETGEIAIKAALTGHMVFSTLHTNDCPSTVGRMIDMGIPPYLVASAVNMIMSQRLLRRICTNCKVPVKNMDPEFLKEAGFHKSDIPELKLYHGEGCSKCSGTGYKGRVAVYELLEVSEDLRQAITSNVNESTLRKIARKEGMKTLREEGLQKAREGLTTVDEVLQKTIKEKDILPAYLLTPDERIFEDSDLIINEGNDDTAFYQLIQGCLSVSINEKIVGEITQPGEYFGESSALLKESRTATIKSKGKSIVKVFPGEKLLETLENYPKIAFSLVSSLANRLKETNRRVVTLSRQTKPQLVKEGPQVVPLDPQVLPVKPQMAAEEPEVVKEDIQVQPEVSQVDGDTTRAAEMNAQVVTEESQEEPEDHFVHHPGSMSAGE